jgi:hypothetical protein
MERGGGDEEPSLPALFADSARQPTMVIKPALVRNVINLILSGNQPPPKPRLSEKMGRKPRPCRRSSKNPDLGIEDHGRQRDQD